MDHANADVPPPVPQVTHDDLHASVECIEACLSNQARTDRRIMAWFDEAAIDDDGDQTVGVNLDQAESMVSHLASELEVPEWVFYDMDFQFQRFEFTKDGELDKEEARKMFKTMMRNRLALAPELDEDNEVPYSTLEDGGYTVIKEMGRGGQGVMYHCTKHWGFSPFCVKLYEKASASAAGVQEVREEIQAFKSYNSPNVTKTFDIFQDQEFYYVVSEPYLGGDLTKLGAKAREKGVTLSESWMRDIFRQSLEGLDYLHGQAQMHCDIKEPNIMIACDDSFRKPRAVLIDFGVSKAFSAISSVGVSGTPGYIPPETWAGGVWHPRGDIFSLGTVFFQLMSGCRGVWTVGASTMEEVQAITKQRELPWEEFPQDMPELQELIGWMTNKDRMDRPRPHDALGHHWFAIDTNENLPRTSVTRLCAWSVESDAEDQVLEQLDAANNLDQLRGLMTQFDAIGTDGAVEKDDLVRVLRDAGVEKTAATEYAGCLDDGSGYCRYETFMDGIIKDKEQFGLQLILDLFNRVDKAKSSKGGKTRAVHLGARIDMEDSRLLTKAEVEEMLHSTAFECDRADIDELIDEMDQDGSGRISVLSFKRVVMNDGRIGHKSVSDAHKVRDGVGGSKGNTGECESMCALQ